MATSRKFPADEQRRLLAALEAPFDPAMLKWMVVRKAKSGRRGAVLPYADPRAYTDRLNHVVTPRGWVFVPSVSTLPNLSRRLWNGKSVQTGKVIVEGTLTIHRLATHKGNGEAWADREHSVSSAEAQAMRRASACFGLGRYLYWFRETWVSLDRRGAPIKQPILPEWALPHGIRVSGSTRDARGPLDQQLTAMVEGFREHLGDAIYAEILAKAGHSKEARLIPNAHLQKVTLGWMQAATRGFEKARRLADDVGGRQFIAITDSLNIDDMTAVPSLEALRYLVDTLEATTRNHAA
jgi:hypothetical protein